METVFITVHDLSLDARIRYCSDSIEYILGYLPHEVKGSSCWEFFHPDEIPFARAIHGRGIDLDKAAVLNYCRIKHKDGSWIGCECVFTVVYDVLVASTAIYRRGPRARQRALDGAGVRRIFSSSPRDPRYHMLSYLSNKFYHEPQLYDHEPRAALFLNRFTRTSTIMFATNGVATILGLQPDQLVGKSFYYCIAENCLKDAVTCLESAKSNDSIAYLRFWYRDPLLQDPRASSVSMAEGDESDENDDGGVPIRSRSRSRSSVDMLDSSTPQTDVQPISQPALVLEHDSPPKPEPMTYVGDTLLSAHSMHTDGDDPQSRSSSGNSTDLGGQSHDAIFDAPAMERSSSSQTPPEVHETSVEVEAVVSCTSDGLVVVLRKAKPLVPHTVAGSDVAYFANGVFASPWAPEPIMPQNMEREGDTSSSASGGMTDTRDAGFMAAIRDVAVFAWSLTGINGSLAQFSRGTPKGEAQPAGGLPIWDPNSNADPHNLHNGYLGSFHRPIEGVGESAYILKKDEDITSSDDEILWKRSATQPSWRRPQRRGHHDAFGTEGTDKVDGEDETGGRKKIFKPPRNGAG